MELFSKPSKIFEPRKKKTWRDFYREIPDPDKALYYVLIGLSQYFDHGNGD